MKLHTVFITHNRLDLTKRSIESFLETVSVPFSLAIVDNASNDGTQEWLEEFIGEHPETGLLLLAKNRYPGYACNRGWELAPKDADFLQRADNDWVFLPDWCSRVRAVFSNRKVGQVGLRTEREEPVPWNVGGNNVIRRSLWDSGLRYDERPWPQLPKGHSEDTYLSPAVLALGYQWKRVSRPCISGISVESISDPYYRKSWRDRGISLTDQRSFARKANARRK